MEDGRGILDVGFGSHAKARRREGGIMGETGRAVVSAAGAFFGLWFVEGDERCFF